MLWVECFVGKFVEYFWLMMNMGGYSYYIVGYFIGSSVVLSFLWK